MDEQAVVDSESGGPPMEQQPGFVPPQPPNVRPPGMATDPIQQRYNQADVMRQGAGQREQDLERRQSLALDRRGQQEEQLYGGIQKAQASYDQTLQQGRTKVEMPTHKPEPIVNPEDYKNLGYSLLAMTLIGGAISKNWGGASAALDGALKGWVEGDKINAKKKYEDYKLKFNEAMKKQEQANKEFDDILAKKNIPIQQMFTELKIAAAKWGREDMKFAAEHRDIQGVYKAAQEISNSADKLQMAHDRIDMQAQAHQDRVAARDAGKFQVFQTKDNKLVRVNTQTGEVLPFDEETTGMT
jgi:hypothetical protein